MRIIFEDFGKIQEERMELFCDNNSAITIAKNSIYHSQTKHIALKHHFIREAIEVGEIQLKFCKLEEQLADTFTERKV